ncbi:MAG TPA: DUF2550 family protein [Actinotalea sp.]
MKVAAELLVIGLLLGVLVLLVLYVSRQRTLSRRVGSFTCLHRTDGSADAVWTVGTAQYASGRLDWWRAVSLSPRPAQTWSREELRLLERLPLEQQDHAGRPVVLVRCRHRDELFELAMSEGACAGLVSWLESGPRRVGRPVQ